MFHSVFCFFVLFFVTETTFVTFTLQVCILQKSDEKGHYKGHQFLSRVKS
jgi:hypothetical protein